MLNLKVRTSTGEIYKVTITGRLFEDKTYDQIGEFSLRELEKQFEDMFDRRFHITRFWTENVPNGIVEKIHIYKHPSDLYSIIQLKKELPKLALVYFLDDMELDDDIEGEVKVISNFSHIDLLRK